MTSIYLEGYSFFLGERGHQVLCSMKKNHKMQKCKIVTDLPQSEKIKSKIIGTASIVVNRKQNRFWPKREKNNWLVLLICMRILWWNKWTFQSSKIPLARVFLMRESKSSYMTFITRDATSVCYLYINSNTAHLFTSMDA